MITYKPTDITLEKSGLVMHGCNTRGGFGSGVAGAIRNKWPSVYRAFVATGTGKHLLGSIKIININDNLYVCNAYTQEFFGSDGKIYASTNAIDSALNKALAFAKTFNLTFKSPKIGCGLGGLSWDNDVKPIYEKYDKLAKDVNIEIFEYNGIK